MKDPNYAWPRFDPPPPQVNPNPEEEWPLVGPPTSQANPIPEEEWPLVGPPTSAIDPIAPTPPPTGREPTFRERLYIKTYEDTHPEKVRDFVARNGINPQFDKGLQVSDFTTDILGDALKAGAGIGGGVFGAGAGLPGAIAGSVGGGALAQLGLNALSPYVDPEGKGVDQTLGSVGETAALEGIGTAALGAGKVPGLAQHAWRQSKKGLKWLANLAESPFAKILYAPAKAFDRPSKEAMHILRKDGDAILSNLRKYYTEGVKGQIDTSGYSSNLLQNAWKNSNKALTKTREKLGKMVAKDVPSTTLHNLGIDRDLLTTLRRHPDTFALSKYLDKFHAKHGGHVPPDRALDLYKELANPKGNQQQIQRVRDAIRDHVTKGNPDIARTWTNFINDTHTVSELRRANKGFPFMGPRATEKGTVRGTRGRDLGNPNLREELLQKFNRMLPASGENDPLVKTVAEALKKTQNYGKWGGQGEKGFITPDVAMQRLRRDLIGIDAIRGGAGPAPGPHGFYPGGGVLRNLTNALRYVATPINRRRERILYPKNPYGHVKGLEDWIKNYRPGQKKPIPRRFADEIIKRGLIEGLRNSGGDLGEVDEPDS